MRIKSILLVAIMTLFTLSGCAKSKDSYVKDFDKFVEKVKTQCSDYSEADWKKADKTFKKYAETQYDKFSSELSNDELIKVTKLKATYAALQLKRGASAVKEGVKKAVKEGGEAVDELMDDMKKKK